MAVASLARLSRLLVLLAAILSTCLDYAGSYAGAPQWPVSAERGLDSGARLPYAWRDDREYRERVREEQRRQPRGPHRGTRVGVEEGCPARKPVLEQRTQATRRATA